MKREYKTETRFAVTYVNKDGMRTLFCANQGRYHKKTREEAEQYLASIISSNSRETIAQHVGGDAGVESMRVDPMECYEHGDACGVFFKD